MPAKNNRKPQAVAPTPANSSLLGPEKLKQLYSAMLRCRMITEKTRGIINQQMFAKGHEAVEAGCALDLKPEDYLVACHNPAASFVKGTPPHLLFAHLYAQQSLPDPAVQLKIGMATALIYQKQRKPFITLAFVDENLDHQMFNHAAAHKLPVIFVVCGSFSGRRNGIPVIAVDGSDVVAIYRVSQEAVRRARDGYGPTVIACHIEADSNSAPLDFMERYLKQKGLWSDIWKEKLMKDFNQEMDVIVAAIKRFGVNGKKSGYRDSIVSVVHNKNL